MTLDLSHLADAVKEQALEDSATRVASSTSTLDRVCASAIGRG